MIKNIQIKNFQSHKESTITFSKGFNVIHGVTDSGKSAIIRGLNKVINNKPSSDGFRSKWGGDTSIQLNTEDHQIVRLIDKENLYMLGEQKFKAFGQGVPEEISKAININEINFQPGQFNAPFLLSESPGEVARFLNGVANLELIDQSISKINGKIRSTKQSIETEVDKISEYHYELSKLPDVDKLEIVISSIEEKEQKLLSVTEKKFQLTELIEKIIELKSTIDSKEDYAIQEQEIEGLFAIIGKKCEVKENIEKLQKIIELIKTADEIVKQNLYLDNENDCADEVLSKFNAHAKIVKEIRGLALGVDLTSKKITEIKNMSIDIDNQEKEFKKLMPKQCLLCGK